MSLVQTTISSKKLTLIIPGLILSLLLVAGIIASSANAQSQVNWSDPSNLSQSGSATDPVMVVDSDGVYHAIWMDEFAGLVHSSGDGMEWSLATPLTMPSRDTVPFLIADLNGYIHALWTDIDGRLFYSKARASTLPNSSELAAAGLDQ